jgi:hypothetical protein
MTPLFLELWCMARCGSFSSTHIRSSFVEEEEDVRAWRSANARAQARPTMPPPTTTRSKVRLSGNE